MKKEIWLIIPVILLMAQPLQAQTTLNATGGTKTINGNTYSYSIGEMTLVHTASQGGLVVTQGVLQPFKAADGGGGDNGISGIVLTNWQLKVFPNPAKDILYLKANLPGEGRLKAVLYDALGRKSLH